MIKTPPRTTTIFGRCSLGSTIDSGSSNGCCPFFPSSTNNSSGGCCLAVSLINPSLLLGLYVSLRRSLSQFLNISRFLCFFSMFPFFFLSFDRLTPEQKKRALQTFYFDLVNDLIPIFINPPFSFIFYLN